MNVIPYGRQSISQDDIDAVVSVLRSEFLTQGPLVPAFEKAVTSYCGATFGLAVNSATSALHIACLSLGVGKGDLVWTTPITFVASANCALYCGAEVDFVDIDSDTYNMSVECLADKLVEAKKIGRLPKVVIPVHLCGHSCDMAEIFRLSQEYGFKIIEDASHAIGGKYGKKKDGQSGGNNLEPIGGCRYSDITVFSFHPVKIITSGEGGMITTNRHELIEHMRLLRSHGISSDPINMDSRPLDEIWNYQQIELGFNFRMTDIQAALGLSQIKKLDEFVAERHSIAARYNNMLAELPLNVPFQSSECYSSFHLYVIRFAENKCALSQKQAFELLRKNGIGVNLHYIPVYLQPYYQRLGFVRGYCPEAEKYFHEAITLPIYPGLTLKQQDKVVEVLNSFL